jgi:hypothetical protein
MKVFLSYASPDHAWAKRLSAELGGAGLDVWDADRQLFPGENLGLALGRALEESDAFVVLLSPSAAKSRWLEREVQYAISTERFEDRIFSVLLKPTDSYPWILRRLRTLKGSPRQVAKQIATSLSGVA